MKSKRHRAILRLVDTNDIRSQEQLREMLADVGIDVTQATLSRDIRELRLAKSAGPGGASVYTVPTDREIHPSLEQLLPPLLRSVNGVGPLLVLRTPAGSAEALGGALDFAGFEEIIGTIAGDDTLLIITKSERARKALSARLSKMAGI
jgi:transcriptional regulator of arginine metabolism